VGSFDSFLKVMRNHRGMFWFYLPAWVRPGNRKLRIWLWTVHNTASVNQQNVVAWST
jgi:hypothetical protein